MARRIGRPCLLQQRADVIKSLAQISNFLALCLHRSCQRLDLAHEISSQSVNVAIPASVLTPWASSGGQRSGCVAPSHRSTLTPAAWVHSAVSPGDAIVVRRNRANLLAGLRSDLAKRRFLGSSILPQRLHPLKGVPPYRAIAPALRRRLHPGGARRLVGLRPRASRAVLRGRSSRR